MVDIPFGPWVVKPKVVDPLLVFSLAWDARLQGSDRALPRKGLGKMHATLRLGVANHCL